MRASNAIVYRWQRKTAESYWFSPCWPWATVHENNLMEHLANRRDWEIISCQHGRHSMPKDFYAQ